MQRDLRLKDIRRMVRNLFIAPHEKHLLCGGTAEMNVFFQ